MRLVESKTCLHCHAVFMAKHPTAKYCGKLCRNSASVGKYIYKNRNRPEGWVERNFRMNSDGSGTIVKDVLVFDRNGKPKTQGSTNA